MHIKDFAEQKKAFLSDPESTYLATPYLPNLVEFCVCRFYIQTSVKTNIVHLRCSQTTPSGLTVGECLAISKWVVEQGNAEVKAMYPGGDAGLLVDETVHHLHAFCVVYVDNCI